MMDNQPTYPPAGTEVQSLFERPRGTCSPRTPAALARLQQVLLAGGMSYLDTGQLDLWPACAVALGDDKHEYVLAPWLADNPAWAAELIVMCQHEYGSSCVCVFVGEGEAGSPVLRQLLDSGAGWAAYVDTVTGQIVASHGATWYTACPSLARPRGLRKLLHQARTGVGSNLDCRSILHGAAAAAREGDAFVQAVRNPLVRPIVSQFLIATCVTLAAALMLFAGGRLFDFGTGALVAWGANYAPLVKSGQYWRLVTSVFLHGNVIHLLFNMWVLWSIGPLYERLQGRSRMAVAYLAAGVAGSVASLAFHGVLRGESAVGIGASGAIFGLFGALGAMLLVYRRNIPRAIWKTLANGTLAFIGYNILFGVVIPMIDNSAHVGGLAGGFLMGLAVADRPLTRAPWRPRQIIAAAVVAVVIAACGQWVIAHLPAAK